MIPAVRDVGLLGVIWDSIGQDEGLIGGTSSTKVRVKIEPKQQPGLFGGSTYHTFATRNSTERNNIPFGQMVNQGEDVLVTVKPGVVSAAIIVRLNRRRVYAL